MTDLAVPAPTGGADGTRRPRAPGRRRGRPPAHPLPRPPALRRRRPISEPGDANAWADPAEAELWSRLEARGSAVRDRTLRKTEAAVAVLHGELTLDQAAAVFREANAGAVNRYGPLAAMYSGATEEELSCRQVIRFVQGLALREPARVAAALPGLEAELARRFPRTAAR